MSEDQDMQDVTAASQVFVDLDPILEEPLDPHKDRVLVRVRTQALHDLMLAYQVIQMNEGQLGQGCRKPPTVTS